MGWWEELIEPNIGEKQRMVDFGGAVVENGMPCPRNLVSQCQQSVLIVLKERDPCTYYLPKYQIS